MLLTFHGLCDCTLCVQWCHSVHTDPSAAFCTVSPIHSCIRDQNHKSLSRYLTVTFVTRSTSVYKRLASIALTTHYTVHALPEIMQKIYFESSIPQILSTSERGRRFNIAFITNILQMCCRKNEIVIFFLRGNFISVKTSKG